MVRNKSLIGKSGIACSSMGLPFSAVYLPPKAVMGVNPTIYLPEEDIYWMLSFLNSSLVTYLVRRLGTPYTIFAKILVEPSDLLYILFYYCPLNNTTSHPTY